MKKVLLSALCIIAASMYTNAEAIDLSGTLNKVNSAVETSAAVLTPGAVSGQISEINAQLVNADASVQSAFSALVNVLSSKEEALKIQTQINAVQNDKNLNDVEKSAKLSEIMSDYGDTLKENKAELEEQLNNASQEKKEAVSKAIVSLFEAGFQYVLIGKECSNIVTNISKNPTQAITFAPQLGELKNTLSILKNSAKSIKNLTSQSIAVAKAGGIEVKIPKKQAGKTKKVDLTNLKK